MYCTKFLFISIFFLFPKKWHFFLDVIYLAVNKVSPYRSHRCLNTHPALLSVRSWLELLGLEIDCPCVPMFLAFSFKYSLYLQFNFHVEQRILFICVPEIDCQGK